MLEGLRPCRELRRGKPVNWDGRWQVEEVLGPEPAGRRSAYMDWRKCKRMQTELGMNLMVGFNHPDPQ